MIFADIAKQCKFVAINYFYNLHFKNNILNFANV